MTDLQTFPPSNPENPVVAGLSEDQWRRRESNPRKVPPVEAPVAQTTRSRKGCDGCGPCFYCGDDTGVGHEHDHFPIPYRHGGRHVVPSCGRCHHLKDRTKLANWSPAALVAASEGVNLEALAAVAFIQASLHDDLPIGDEHDELAELITRIVSGCEGPETRIALAACFNVLLDAKANS